MLLIKRMRSYIKTRQFENRLFKLAGEYLKNGLYYFSNEKNAAYKIKLPKLSPKNLFHLHLHISFKHGVDESFLLTSGSYKKVIVLDSACICKPVTRERYNDAKKTYMLHSMRVAFPHAKILRFDDKNNCYHMESVHGEHYNDLSHTLVILKSLLEYATKSECHKEQKEYFQHGDAKKTNVIWIDEGANFKFIDMDTLGFYPILFDFIHYSALSSITVTEMVNLLSRSKIHLKKIISKFGIEYEETSTLDDIFFQYVKYYENRGLTNLKRDYIFLLDLDKNMFPKTIAAIKRIIDVI